MAITSIQYAGHSAVFLKAEELVIGIDPWLEGNPLCPAELKNPERLDCIVLTHGHADHAGDAVRLAKHFGSTVIATYELAMIMISEGVPQSHVIPMNKGGSVPWEGLRCTLTNAFHSSSFDLSDGTAYAGEPCGTVISDGDTTIYHAGDTSLFSDMQLIGEFYHPDIALLPIGDHFTMGPKEAARAAQFVGCRTAIPIHYKTFDLLVGSAEEFSAHCDSVGVHVKELTPGQTVPVGELV